MVVVAAAAGVGHLALSVVEETCHEEADLEDNSFFCNWSVPCYYGDGLTYNQRSCFVLHGFVT